MDYYNIISAIGEITNFIALASERLTGKPSAEERLGVHDETAIVIKRIFMLIQCLELLKDNEKYKSLKTIYDADIQKLCKTVGYLMVANRCLIEPDPAND